MNNFKPVIILEPGGGGDGPVCRHPSACPTVLFRRRERAWRPSKPPELGGEGGEWGGEEGR